MTYETAENEYITRIDHPTFADNVGVRQELLLRTTHKDDLHGAFAAAVAEEIKAAS